MRHLRNSQNHTEAKCKSANVYNKIIVWEIEKQVGLHIFAEAEIANDSKRNGYHPTHDGCKRGGDGP